MFNKELSIALVREKKNPCLVKTQSMAIVDVQMNTQDNTFVSTVDMHAKVESKTKHSKGASLVDSFKIKHQK